MTRRVPKALLTVLATACASAVGFADAPAIHQLVFLVLACVFGAGLQVAADSKKPFSWGRFRWYGHNAYTLSGDH
jgi:hypothetical protein